MWQPSEITHICIVGGGNAAQVISALLSSTTTIHVTLLAPFGDECERLTTATASGGGIELLNPDGSTTKGKPDIITKDPAEALKNAQIVLLPLPLFAIPPMCRIIAPHLERNTWVGIFPGQGGVQWIASSLLGLGDDRKDVSLFGLDKLPYNCRTLEYGKQIKVYAYKEHIGLASIPNDPLLAARMAATVSTVLPHLQLFTVPNFLVPTLAPGNQCIHPARMYSLFKDCEERDEIPMFYEMNDEEAGYIQAVSDDIQAIARGIEVVSKEFGQAFDLSDVLTVGDGVLKAYDDVKDTSSLAKIFSSCEGFKGIGTPMKSVARGEKTVYQVDWGSRYFVEDVPALCVLHGLAQIVGVEVPMMDKLIRWAQPHIGYTFLNDDGKLNMDRKREMYTPQYWGIETKEQLVRFHAVKNASKEGGN